MPDGTFWVASEGAGNLVDGISDPGDRPLESPNALIQVYGASGTTLDLVFPPLPLTRDQFHFGFEGVAATDDALYVAFLRASADAGDPTGRARLGRYNLAAGTWSFASFPLDLPLAERRLGRPVRALVPQRRLVRGDRTRQPRGSGCRDQAVRRG